MKRMDDWTWSWAVAVGVLLNLLLVRSESYALTPEEFGMHRTRHSTKQHPQKHPTSFEILCFPRPPKEFADVVSIGF